MGISVEDAVKELQARETVFVAYSQATKLPYVTCGEETYNDQVWFFAEEETLKEYGKKKLEDKVAGLNESDYTAENWALIQKYLSDFKSATYEKLSVLQAAYTLSLIHI